MADADKSISANPTTLLLHYQLINDNVSITSMQINRALSMAIESFGDNPKKASVKAGKRSQRIVDELRREIVLGLLPPEETLLELELAKRFECSQSTVRESLLALHEEGLVVRFPNRGTVVAECLRDDMIELIRLRHDIECRGIDRVINRYDRLTHRALSALVSQMVEAAHAADEYQLSLLDQQFHLRLYREANLPSVNPILHRCLIHNHRFKILNSERSSPLIVTAERHWPIVEALDSGDRQTAIDALSRHITTIVDFGPSILTSPTAGTHNP
ncbi:MAG: GntR family transcriptional regulator [Granulosicoccus sp.]